MRRLARHVFTILSALSLVLCVAVCVLWVRSYRVGDDISWQSPGRIVSFQSGSGRAGFYGVTSEAGELADGVHQLRWAVFDPQDLRKHFVDLVESYTFSDFAITYFPSSTMHFHNVLVPYWFLFSVTIVFPLLWVTFAWRESILFRRGHCHSCGYDLRASPERCPECGSAVKRAG